MRTTRNEDKGGQSEGDELKQHWLDPLLPNANDRHAAQDAPSGDDHRTGRNFAFGFLLAIQP